MPVPLLAPRPVNSSQECGWSAAAGGLEPPVIADPARDRFPCRPECLGVAARAIRRSRKSGGRRCVFHSSVPVAGRVAQPFLDAFSRLRGWIFRCSTPPHPLRGAGVRFRPPGVDNARSGGLYTAHTVRRRLGAMARPRSSSLIFGDQPPIKNRRFGASTASRAIRGGDLHGSGLFDK